MGKGFWLSGWAGCKSEQLIGGCAEDSNSSKVRKLFSKKVAIFSVFLLMIICASAVFAAGVCVPCRANYYCKDGIPIMCPADKPVTNGNGGKSEADCMSCTTRNGAGNPFFGGYNLGVGLECTSCAEDNEDTPFWNGSACVSCAAADANKPVWNNGKCEACPVNTVWDSDSLICKSSTSCKIPSVTTDGDCVFTIPHNGGTLCLVEQKNVGDYLSCPSNDCWADSVSYCESKGLRLVTMGELMSIAHALYGLPSTCEQAEYCDNNISSNPCEEGFCDYTDITTDLTVANEELWKFLAQSCSSDYFQLLATLDDFSISEPYYREFSLTGTNFNIDNYTNWNPSAICIRP